MSIRFKTFRHALCAIIALTAAVALSLSIALSRTILRRGIAWLLVIVELLSMIRSMWSMFRQTVSGGCQPVASEAISLFALFPFQLIIVFVISTFPLQHQQDMDVFYAMQAFAVLSAALHLLYTSGLITIATLTVKAFDKDVWVRDIDITPSPFPLPIIFAFLFPCLTHLFEATRPFKITENLPIVMCLSGCTCSRKGCNPPIGTTELTNRASPESSIESDPTGIPGSTSSNLSEEPLIRVPNAAERRACIFVNLDTS